MNVAVKQFRKQPRITSENSTKTVLCKETQCPMTSSRKDRYLNLFCFVLSTIGQNALNDYSL